jgi:hypothetical protein
LWWLVVVAVVQTLVAATKVLAVEVLEVIEPAQRNPLPLDRLTQ